MRSRSARRSPRSAARARPTSPSSCSAHRATRRALRPRASTSEARVGAPRHAIADGVALEAPTSAGSRRRAAIPTRIALPTAPVVRPVAAVARRLGRAPRGAARRAARRSTSAPAGASKDDAIDHAVGIVCRRSAATGVEGRAARRDPRARRGVRAGAGSRRGARFRARATQPAERQAVVLDVIG